jgi:peptidoglycan/xylan/chitin deacetylase (PgdA/CDA1 family)
MEQRARSTDRSTNRTLAILGFHKIGEPSEGDYPTWNYVPESVFVDQLGQLKENGWEIIDLETFLRGLSDPHALPTHSALLTFDDGYRTMLTVTLPILRRFGYPAVLFVPTSFIGGRNTFDEGIEPVEDICSWDELRELERQGVSVQSHGVTHRAFSSLDTDALRQELEQSKTELESGLDKSIEVIAYPYGDAGANPEVTNEILERAGYRAACLYGGGANAWPVTNVYGLTRFAMGPDTDLSALLTEP